jgi:two-component system, LytTR family, response regulator
MALPIKSGATRRLMETLLKAVIVDDEPLGRETIRLRLADEPDVAIAGEASNGKDAVELIKKTRPDVVFMDVKMPGMDGFEVIDMVSPVHLPIVVFVTAHDVFAVRAFERHALDYLLKPFTASRFATALDRARFEVARAGDPETHDRLIAFLDEQKRQRETTKTALRGGEPYLARFAVHRNHRIVLIGVEDIDWIESCANYARLHVQDVSHLVRMTMSELERRLDPARFARIHRSAIVRIACIDQIIPALHGDFNLTLRDGTALKLSRNYRSNLQA